MRDQERPEAIQYIKDTFATDDDLLATIQHDLEAAGKEHLLGMQLGADEGKFLQFLIASSGAKKIVEVGTFVGYSVICMGRALPEGGHIYTLEKSPEHAQMAKDHIKKVGLSGMIEVREGEALEQLQAIASEGPFDMIFIDADKGGYPVYLDWAEENIRPGGIIVGDNTFLFGAVYQDECPENVSEKSWLAMKEFNRRLADPKKYISTLIPTHEGMTVAFKR